MVKQFIKKKQRRLEKSVKENDNSLTAKVYVKLLSWLRPFYFTDEFLLVNGFKKANANAPQSILFFTVHKAASTFVKNTIMGLVDGQLTTIRLAGYLQPKKHAVFFNDKKKMSRVLLNKGFFYGAIRDYYDFPKMDEFKILLLLRDPRDVLTSQYFTVLYNHPIGRKEILDRRRQFENFTVDEFVLDQAHVLLKKYEDYSKYLINRSNVLLLKYEDMISDFSSWLYKLAGFLGVTGKEVYINELISKTKFEVKKEDPKAFIRNITPGDHIRKLKPETIEKLNAMFRPSMTRLGYSV